MGYLIKSDVVDALKEDMGNVMMCYEGKERKDIIAFCYESMERIIDEIPQYWPDNMREGISLTPERIRELAERDTAKTPVDKECQDIIRKHMSGKDTYVPTNDGWIPVEKALPPEPPEYVDDEDDLEQYIVMIDGAERPTTLRYAGDGTWWEDGTYYHVIAWRSMPEVYRPVDKTERSEGE